MNTKSKLRFWTIHVLIFVIKLENMRLQMHHVQWSWQMVKNSIWRLGTCTWFVLSHHVDIMTLVTLCTSTPLASSTFITNLCITTLLNAINLLTSDSLQFTDSRLPTGMQNNYVFWATIESPRCARCLNGNIHHLSDFSFSTYAEWCIFDHSPQHFFYKILCCMSVHSSLRHEH